MTTATINKMYNDGDDKVDNNKDVGGGDGDDVNVVIKIRRLNEHGGEDGPSVAKIWKDGLQQTIDESSWPFRIFFTYLFEKEVQSTLGPNGDIGPDGSNLYKFWIGVQDDGNTNNNNNIIKNPNPTSDFFVATINNKVVGCVGLKVGQTSLKHHCESTTTEVKEDDKEEEDVVVVNNNNTDESTTTTTFVSVWRLSVDENYRRLGIATKLMETCHTWAKTKYDRVDDYGAPKITHMKLITGNPVAIKFYLKLGYQYEHWYSIGSLIKPLN